MKLLPLFILLGSLLFPADVDHLLLTRVVTQPTSAESFSIYNPTDNSINLSNYYICDDENYYEIQTKADMSPSHFLYGFTARFPNINIEPNDTLIIGLNYKYDEFYKGNTPADLVMYLDQVNSMIETEDKSFGRSFSDIDGDDNDYGLISADSCNTKEGIWYGNDDDLTAYCGDGIGCNGTEITYCNEENNQNCIEECEDISPVGKLDDISELLILFYWDGDLNNPIQDVDYFLWGSDQNPLDKSGISGYQNETSGIDQLYFNESTTQNYAYSRIGVDEIGELETGSNGISGHDETSENFRKSWTIVRIPEFIYGCTDIYAVNYNSLAEYEINTYYEHNTGLFEFNPSFSCRYSFKQIINNEFGIEYPNMVVYGRVVDFFDIRTVSESGSGPQNITIEDENGYRITITVWDWEVADSEISEAISKYNKNMFYVWATGDLGFYEDGNEWQVEVASSENIIIAQNFTSDCEYESSPTPIKTSINPEPFIIIPILDETLNYNFTFPDKSRVIVRIFDISGRFITSLVDKYYASSGIEYCNDPPASWDGRDQLGQIVSPGTYIMHIEAMNPVTGETQTDAAPIVVGVKN